MPESPTMSPAAPEAGIDIVPTPADGTVQETTVVVTEHEVLLGTAAALASSLELGDTEPEAPAVPPRRRLWRLTVACLGVALVISSMAALNTVLGEIAVRYGRRCALLLGLATVAAASLAPVIQHSATEIIASRGGAGVGERLG